MELEEITKAVRVDREKNHKPWDIPMMEVGKKGDYQERLSSSSK